MRTMLAAQRSSQAEHYSGDCAKQILLLVMSVHVIGEHVHCLSHLENAQQ